MIRFYCHLTIKAHKRHLAYRNKDEQDAEIENLHHLKTKALKLANRPYGKANQLPVSNNSISGIQRSLETLRAADLVRPIELGSTNFSKILNMKGMKNEITLITHFPGLVLDGHKVICAQLPWIQIKDPLNNEHCFLRLKSVVSVFLVEGQITWLQGHRAKKTEKSKSQLA